MSPMASAEAKDPSTPGHNLQREISERGLSLEVLAAAQERGVGRKGRDWGKQEGERRETVSGKWRNACPPPHPRPEPLEQV